MAEIIILLDLLIFKFVFSECCEIIGVISATPSSVTFSKNHSKRSVFFVKEIPIFKDGLIDFICLELLIFSLVLFLLISIILQS